MKCPVCDNVNRSMVCLRCGFDSSRDYGKYPSFGGVSRAPSVSGLRKQWEETGEKVAQVPVKRRKLMPLLIAAAFVLTLVLGIWIGTGFGGGSGESVQMQILKICLLTAPQVLIISTSSTDTSPPAHKSRGICVLQKP